MIIIHIIAVIVVVVLLLKIFGLNVLELLGDVIGAIADAFID